MIVIILSAAICAFIAGTGAAIVWSAEKHMGLPKKLAGALQLAFLVLGLGLIRLLPVEAWARDLTPRATMEARVERALETQPLFGVMRDHYPADYAALKTSLEQGLRADEAEDELIARARPIILKRYTLQMAKASDDSVLMMIDLAVDQADHLMTLNPRYCHEMFNTPDRLSFNPAKVFPERLAQRDIKLMERVLIETANQPDYSITPLPSSTLASMAEATLAGLSREDIVALSQIDFEVARARNQAEMMAGCRFTLGMLKIVANLPPKQAALTFRSLVTS